MLLAFSVVDGFDFQLIAIALELLVLFRSAFHRQQAVRRGEKDNRVMLELQDVPNKPTERFSWRRTFREIDERFRQEGEQLSFYEER